MKRSPSSSFRNNPSHAATSSIKSRDWTPGDPIRFQENLQDKRSAGEWMPGQKIRFAGEENPSEEERAKAETVKGGSGTSEASRNELARFSIPHPRTRSHSPTDTRATFNSSPRSSFELAGNSSWDLSNRWEPPSFESRSGSSSSSTAIFSHSRSYAKVPRPVRASTFLGDEEEEDTNLNDLLARFEPGAQKVDVAIQTESPPSSRLLITALPEAELEDLVAGIDWSENESSLELDELHYDRIPSTSTPPRLCTTAQMNQLSQIEMGSLLEGIDFNQVLEVSDSEEDSFHTAIAHSPVDSSPTLRTRCSSPSVPCLPTSRFDIYEKNSSRTPTFSASTGTKSVSSRLTSLTPAFSPSSIRTKIIPTTSYAPSFSQRRHFWGAPPKKLREPSRDSFVTDKAYKAALKDYEFKLKWPVHFDRTACGEKEPAVVFTTNETDIKETLAKLKGPVGMDMEWDVFSLETGGQGKTALIQICDQETILMVHTAKMSSFPKSLQAFLEDPTRIKLGVRISGDAKKLERDFAFTARGILELNHLSKRVSPQHHTRYKSIMGLQELVGIYLDRYLPKAESIRCGEWSKELSDSQKDYAANDVYSSLQVFLAIESLNKSSTDTPLDLFDFTTPNTKPPPVKKKLTSLHPIKVRAFMLFHYRQLLPSEIATTMSKSTPIKPTTVLSNLLETYAVTEGVPQFFKWDEKRLVEAVDSLSSAWKGKMKDEHEPLVESLRRKIAGPK